MDIISAKYSTSNYDSEDEPLSGLTQNNLSSNKDNSTNRMLEALAVGPRGENMDVLLDLVKQVFHTHETARKEYLPNDTHHITKEIKESESFQKTQEMLQEKLDTLNNRLKEYSVPFSGFLHLANMVPDPTIPAFAGYIAGMLYNQNNLSGEAGQSTIHIEIEVANKILEMFNFPEFQSLEPEHLKDPAKIEPWCHLTPGGTIGNLEAFWGARAVKFYPLAARRALTEDNLLSSIAKKIMVKTAKGESKLLVECSAWELINICCDEALCLTRRIYDSFLARNRRKRNISLVDIYKTIISYSIQQEGVLSAFEYLHNIDAENKENRIKNPVYFASSTAHYSMLKSSALIGSGTKSFKLVKVDKASRLDIDDLEKQLEKCVETRTPVFITVAIMGTTVESAVDPLSDILDLRAKFRKEHGLDFNIHVDAAYGAYFASLLKPYPGRPDYNLRKDDLTAIARASLNEYSSKQYRRINEADTLTLDPHKTGYIPYPCGASIQRNHLLKNLLHFEGPYTSGSVVGFYGIEGSKGGAAACSAWLAHECLPLHIGGHGSLLGLILYNTKRFYARLMDIGFQTDKDGNLVDVPIRVVPLAKLPEERKDNPDMKEVQRQYQSVIHDIARKSDQELTQRIYEDDDFADFFNEVGPDLGVLCYHFNFKNPQTGEWNRSLAAANMFNQKLYEKMSVKWQDPKNPQSVKDLPVVVTKTSISRSRESESLYDDMLARTNCYERMGDQDSATGITLLKTAMMQPFISETTSGSFFDVVIQEFTKVTREVLTDNQALWTIESAGL